MPSKPITQYTLYSWERNRTWSFGCTLQTYECKPNRRQAAPAVWEGNSIMLWSCGTTCIDINTILASVLQAACVIIGAEYYSGQGNSAMKTVQGILGNAKVSCIYIHIYTTICQTDYYMTPWYLSPHHIIPFCCSICVVACAAAEPSRRCRTGMPRD